MDLEQVQLEREMAMLKRGQEKYLASIAEAKEDKAEDRLQYGQKVMAQAVIELQARITEYIEARKERKGGPAPIITKLQVKPANMAAITLQHMASSLHGERELTSVALKIGQAVEAEHRWTLIYGKDEDHRHHWAIMQMAQKMAKEAWEPGKMHPKARAARFLKDREAEINKQVPRLDKNELIGIGTALVSVLCHSADLGFELEAKHVKAKKTSQPRYLVKMTEEKAKAVTASIQAGLLRAADLEPMVCPPRDWIADTIGGYVSNDGSALTRIGTHKFVRGDMQDGDFEAMPKVVEAVNKAQRTAWSINKKVLDVFNWVFEDEALKKKSGMLSVDTTGARTVLNSFHRIGNELAGFDAFYVPHNLCWRGRVMALPMFSFQGPDCVRGLFEYAEKKPLRDGERWMSLHIANSWGNDVDKAPLDTRWSFAERNSEMLLRIASNPKKYKVWMKADAPFLFLAGCFEWEAYTIHKVMSPRRAHEFLTGMPVGFDGANNAIQHGSSFLKDAEGAAWVNVCEASTADKPADLYTAVAKEANRQLNIMKDEVDSETFGKGGKFTMAQWAQKWLDYGVKRKTCKRIVMTRGYAGSMYGASDMIMDDVISKDENHPFGEDARQASVFLGQLVHRAAMAVLSGLARSMEFLQGTVENRPDAATAPLVYVHPETGFIFRQAYWKKKIKRVNLKGMPQGRVDLQLASNDKKIDVRKMAAGISANFTHSNDAAHLMMTTLACDFELGLVHDSFSATAGDCDELYRIVREQFIKLHSNNLLKVVADAYKHVQPLPESGNLDVNVVANAPYAFI